jgi:N-acetylglutamate synthase-like GNAT family acetyltransferase
VLEDGAGLQGYAVSHPWRFGAPPQLNSRLGQLPDGADTFYVHDIALLPTVRGMGFGAAIVERLARLAMAAGLRTMSLIAVSGSADFWQRQGFEIVEQPLIRARLLSYGAAAQFMVRRLA